MEQTEIVATETNSTPTPNRVNKTPRLPTTEESLKNLAQWVLEKWKTDPIELRYCTIDNFEVYVKDFTKTLLLREQKGDKRKPVSKQLQDLDKEINEHIEDVKAYIKAEKGVKQAEPFFPQFGIEKINKSFKFPVDRDARLRSLKKLVSALEEHKLNDKTYGKDYWGNILEQYAELLQQAIQTDSEIAGKVREKNTAKDEIKKVLACLMKLIEGHYPDDYEAVWREWGFQRARY